METPVKCNIFKIFRVARFKRFNCKVNLINLSLLLTRDTFSFPPSKLNEARGWAGALIWNETGGYYLLKASGASSGKRYVTLPYNISIKQS